MLIDTMTRNVLSNELQTAKPARSGLQSKQLTGLVLNDISQIVASALGSLNWRSFGLKCKKKLLFRIFLLMMDAIDHPNYWWSYLCQIRSVPLPPHVAKIFEFWGRWRTHQMVGVVVLQSRSWFCWMFGNSSASILLIQDTVDWSLDPLLKSNIFKPPNVVVATNLCNGSYLLLVSRPTTPFRTFDSHRIRRVRKSNTRISPLSKPAHTQRSSFLCASPNATAQQSRDPFEFCRKIWFGIDRETTKKNLN